MKSAGQRSPGHPTLNGIDYLEVLGFDADPLGLPPQTILMVRCLKPVPAGLTPDNIIIAGGESITSVKAVWATPATTPPAPMTAAQKAFFTSLPNAAEVLLVGTSTAGDFSPYICGWSIRRHRRLAIRLRSRKC